MRSLPAALPETDRPILPSAGYSGRKVATKHRFSHIETVETTEGVRGNALIYTCTETNVNRRWGFEMLGGESCDE